METTPQFVPFGEQALTVEFGDVIDADTNLRVLRLAAAVQQAEWPGVIEVVPTYRSATLYFDPLVTDATQLTASVRTILANTTPPSKPATPKTHTIPICYGGLMGPDLADLAERAGLTSEAAAALHASVTYRVYMLGFSPGFPYLGTVPEAIAGPRLATPRKQVAAGSVGIAGDQTGIYSQDSPGGWRIVGRTPVRLFSLTRPKPFLLAPGDLVRFVAIDHDEFDALSGETP